MNAGSMTNQIAQIVNAYMQSQSFQQNTGENMLLFDAALHLVLNGNYKKYHIAAVVPTAGTDEAMSEEYMQKKLSNLNERESGRKDLGVYYTPQDVTQYIVANAFINFICPDNVRMFHGADALAHLCGQKSEGLEDLLFHRIVLDPTCGAGEFLVTAYQLKTNILEWQGGGALRDDAYLAILDTIKGNDINSDSTDISKVRLFLKVINQLSPQSFLQAAEILSRNFTNQDYVLCKENALTRCDFIVGNPPYVEYNKLSYCPNNSYGNIYADVMKNCVLSLARGGVFGLVVPLSYISTTRMRPIRAYVAQNIGKEFCLSFGDRPDCLFAGVHQKLCIVLGVKSGADHTMYTSKYYHWYKSEREQLLCGCEVVQNDLKSDQFIPKIGNELERSIFAKSYTDTAQNILKTSNAAGTAAVYLNMRGTFYIKAFSVNPGSNEYKKFQFDAEKQGFALCLLNSSLYYTFWTMMSDCWHITNKELAHFGMPEAGVDYAQFTALQRELEEKLERTKVYIGTKQTEYEYKHKACIDVIHRIDDALAPIFGLTQAELSYIKSYDIKYRLGTDAS